MNMKLSQLKTHFSADEAYSTISFLSELQQLLWSAYRDDIIKMHYHEMMQSQPRHTNHNDPVFDDDDIPF